MARKRIFISYAKEDIDMASRFYEAAAARGFDVFLDLHSMQPGRWRPQIERAISQADIFVLMLSKNVRNKVDGRVGFIEEEINFAYGIAANASSSEFQMLPVRLDDEYRGDFRCSIFQQYDLFPDFEVQVVQILDKIGGADSSAVLEDRVATFWSAHDYVNAYATLLVIEDRGGVTLERTANKAVLLFNMGRRAEAVALMKTLVEAGGSSIGIMEILATMLLFTKQFPELVQVLKRLIELEPSKLKYRSMLFEACDRGRLCEFVKSPIVGSFFSTRDLIHSPGDPWFFQGSYCRAEKNARPIFDVGDVVAAGEVFGFVYAMTVLNELEAERPFVIKDILVGNDELVEYDQPLVEVVYID